MLLSAYGPPPARNCWNPLKQLIYSLLSPRTKTETSHAVLAALEQRYSHWEQLRDAPGAEVEQLVAPVTFPEKKAAYLQSALRRITRQCGTLSLDFLHGHPVERVRRWLETFDGVGPKTSASVVNFSTLRMPALAIDSHHHRIAIRLQLVPHVTTSDTERRLMAMAPPEWTPEVLDEHHSLVKLHGQRCCTALDWQRNCPACPLLGMCPTGKRRRGAYVSLQMLLARQPRSPKSLRYARSSRARSRLRRADSGGAFPPAPSP